MKVSLKPCKYMASCQFMAAILLALLMAGARQVQAQARQEVTYDDSQNQFTALFQRTLEDYNLHNPDGSASRIEMNGVVAEYSWRRYYPVEVVARASYSLGSPLGQSLMSFTAGAGYTRQIYRRYFPFVRVTAGVAHTSSKSYQYLYDHGSSGFAMNVAGGLDVNLTRRWGVRAIDFQNQYLPFGVRGRGSVYWSFGTGAYIRFGN